MCYFWFSCLFSLSACFLLHHWTCHGQQCVLVCVHAPYLLVYVCQLAPAVGSTGFFKVYGRWWIGDVQGQGKVWASCRINNGSTAVAVFIVTMEGGHSSVNGRWYTRYSARCQLAWTPDSVSSLMVSSAGCEIGKFADRCGLRVEKGEDLMVTCTDALHTFIKTCSHKVEVFHQRGETIRGSAAVEVVNGSYKERRGVTNWREGCTGKGDDTAYRSRLMWSHIDWPTSLRLKQEHVMAFPLCDWSLRSLIESVNCNSFGSPASFVTFLSHSSQITRSTGDSCTSKAAESQWILEVKDKEVDLFL